MTLYPYLYIYIYISSSCTTAIHIDENDIADKERHQITNPFDLVAHIIFCEDKRFDLVSIALSNKDSSWCYLLDYDPLKIGK